MMSVIPMVAGAVAALSLNAVPRPADVRGMDTGQPPGATSDSAQAEIPAAVREVTMEAAGAGVLHLLNRIAIASGQIAEERAHSYRIKALGIRIDVSHTGYQARLTRWLAGNGEARAILKEVPSGHPGSGLRLPAWLRHLPDGRFDRAFLRATIEMETRGLRFVDAASAGLEDRDLKQLLEDVADGIRDQRETARGLLEEGALPGPRQSASSWQTAAPQ